MKPETPIRAPASALSDRDSLQPADDDRLILDEREFTPVAPRAPEADRGPDAAQAEPRRHPLTLSALLRGAGALVIVAAFVLYLFEGWREGDALTRYLILLGHTVVLTLTGFALGHWLREPRGARLLVALGLAAVPVNFAFLGGITYDRLAGDAARGSAEGAWDWLWSVGAGLAPGMVLPLTLAALAVLALAVRLAYQVLARASAAGLAAAYLGANALLLVPTRAEAVIAGLLVAATLSLAWIAWRLRRRDPALATAEGRFARLVLALPLLVLAGRSVWLYAPGEVFFTTLALLGYLAVRQTALGLDAARRGGLELLALLLALATAWMTLVTLVELNVLPPVLRIPMVGAVFAALLWDLGTVAVQRSAGYRAAAAFGVAASVGANLAAFTGMGTAFTALASGLLVLAYGYAARGRAVFVLGLLTALGGLAVIGERAVAAFTLGGWTGLVALGVLTLIAGSVLERHGPALRSAASRWTRHFAVH
jgi:hypothetical protein